MRFTVTHSKEHDLSLVALQDTATKIIITVLPAYGALLHSFDIPWQQGRLNIIENYPDKETLDKELALSYKSSKLSPFVCRIADGKYTMDDEVYEFSRKFIDGNAIHGLLYNKSFNIVDEYVDDQKAVIAMRYSYKKDDPGYPFNYVCEVRYTLHPQQTLQVETIVLNLEDEPIPLADGWHPYFHLGGTIDDYEMQFASDRMLEFNERLLPTGNLEYDDRFAAPASLRNIQLDNCFLLNVVEGSPCCILHNPQNGLTLSFYTNMYYPYLQVYTPDHRKSIAIENLSSAPDAFNNGMGLMMLPPRQSQTFTVWYQLSMP
jgi:aldose 1-epimerase